MVRVREEVEGAREKELEAIVQLGAFCFRAYICLGIVHSRTVPLVNRCQSFLQKAIGDPVQAREAASIQANLTLALERLSAHDDKINGKLDSLTVVSHSESLTLQREPSSVCSSSRRKAKRRNPFKNNFRACKASKAESWNSSRHSILSFNPFRST